MHFRFLAVSAAVALAGGCTSDEHMRLEGVTSGVGNAVAANTVMQMVDPWQPGVENTNLKVPADRGLAPEFGPDESMPASGAAGVTNN